jgi:hypothetical protein
MTNINIILIYGLAFTVSTAGRSAIAAPTLPDFGAATFEPNQPVDNLYFPLTEGVTRIYAGERIDGNETILERFELETLGPGPTILGVQTTVQRDRAFENNVLVEDTLDYYAQDTTGNVWYFGEDVTNFLFDSMGNPAGTDSVGTWRAGVNNGLPGYIMPADLTIGFNYYQEFAPNDDAVDQATTISIEEMVSIDIGKFSNVLKVLETSELNPDFRELKYYAPGRGLVFVEEGVDANLMDPEFTIELTRITTENDGDEEDADEEEDEDGEENEDDTSMGDTDDDAHDDRDMDDDHETYDMDADDESHETDDHSDTDDENPSPLRARKLGTSLVASGAVASALRHGLDLTPQIIEQALKPAESKRDAMVLENMDGGLLTGTTILESSTPNFLAAGVSSSSAQSQSTVPEPSTLVLTILVAAGCCIRPGRAA